MGIVVYSRLSVNSCGRIFRLMTSFFQGLADVLLQFGGWLVPFSVLREYEGGVLLRFGRFQRVLGPGFVWHWPMGIDEILKVNVAFDTMTTHDAGFTTLDGVSVAAAVAVGYRITDVQRFIVDVEDADSVVVDATSGTLRQLASQRTWAQIRDAEFEEEVYKAVRKRAFKYGVTVDSVFFRTLTKLGLKEGAMLLLGRVV